MSFSFSQVLLKAKQSSDIVLAVVAAAILAAMIVPLPGWLLDIGLALNLAAAVTLLVAALYAKDALKVASFPTLLLLTTLFRLAMNVSSTRLALAEGHAGDIIQAFGEFVVRGEYVVGAVIFAILTLVQFLVVAKGAERVAEVSARFTLDAMPGKQMSIDADLRSGAIDQADARNRRRALEREAQMYGAMDGAMKFIKGDVIAGLIVVFINLIGGMAIGTLQNGLSLSEAAQTYALIAIGDGLVSQIPSLCIAMAAGLVVTRVSAEKEEQSLGDEIGRQFLGTPRALYVVGGLCGALALMPGMPHLTFMVIGLCLAGLGYGLAKDSEASAAEGATKEGDASASDAVAGAPQPEVASPGVPPIAIELAPDLTPLTEKDGQAFSRHELEQVREQLFLELGVRVPSIHVRIQAKHLEDGTYCLLLDDVPAAKGAAGVDLLLVRAAPEDLKILGIDGRAATDPKAGTPASLIPAHMRSRVESAGFEVMLPTEVICAHLYRLLRRRAADLLGVQEVQSLLESFEPHAPALVKEALGKVPLPLLTEVLRKLVQEEVSIRNIRCILEALVAPHAEGDASALAELCRRSLHRFLSHKYAPHGSLFAYLVDPAIEQDLRGATSSSLAPDRVANILEGLRRVAHGGRTVVLTAPDVRRPLRRLFEGAFPDVAVLTYAELNADLEIRPVGKLVAVRAS